MLKVLQVGGDFDSSKGMPTYVAECWSMHVCLGLVVCLLVICRLRTSSLLVA